MSIRKATLGVRNSQYSIEGGSIKVDFFLVQTKCVAVVVVLVSLWLQKI